MAFKLKEEIKDIAKYSTSYNNIGLVFYKIDDTEKALENFQKALYYKLQEGDTLRTISTHYNMGLVYNELGNDSMALANFYKGVEYSKRFNETRKLAAVYGGLGSVYTRINNLDSARYYLSLSIEQAERLKSKAQQSFNYYTFAKLHSNNKAFDKARDYITRSQELAKQINDKQRQKNNFKLLAEIFEHIDEFDSAFYYQKMYSVLEDEIFNEGLARNLANIQIALSEEQNLKVIEAQEERLTKNKQISLFLLSILALSVTLIIVIFRNYRNTSRINRQLNESSKEIAKQKENLEKNNEKLAKAQRTINDQNAILKGLNSELEKKVDNRTRELISSNKDLEKAVHDLDQFIYKTSHDLRGPIATMMGVINLGVLESSDERMTEYFTTLNKVTDNLNNVLSRLIEVHETYQKKPVLRKINPTKEIQETIQQISKFIDKSTTTIQAELNANGSWTSDRELFTMIIENMLRSALLYTDREDSLLTVKSNMDKKNLKISFIDNGFGIQPGDEKKVFNIFFKGSPKPGGTGLEIYTAKIAVEKLGGKIKLTKPVNDTIFEIELPVLDQS
jgi:signal transduction histidine kinase